MFVKFFPVVVTALPADEDHAPLLVDLRRPDCARRARRPRPHATPARAKRVVRRMTAPSSLTRGWTRPRRQEQEP